MDDKPLVTAPCVVFAFEHVSIPQPEHPSYESIFQPKKGPNQKEKVHFLKQLSQHRQNLFYVLTQSTTSDVHIQAAENFLSLLVHVWERTKDNDNIAVKKSAASWSSAIHFQSVDQHKCDDPQYDISMAYLTLAYLLANKANEAIHTTGTSAEEALKAACQCMRQAAGVVQALQTTVTSQWTNIAIGRSADVVPPTVDALICMFMGEAHQLAIWKGNLSGSISPGSLAKLHLMTSKLYEKAEGNLRSLHEVDLARLDPGIKQFVHSQVMLNRALAFKYLAMSAHTDGKFGQAVGYMRRAKVSAPKIFPTPVTRLTTLRAHVEAELQVIHSLLASYEHENSTIYYEAVPLDDQLTLPEAKPLFEPLPFAMPPLPVKLVDLRSAP